jgi:hypothetical protein
MDRKTNKLAKVAGVGILLMGVVACPGSNPLVMSANVLDGALSISTTQTMPQGWFGKSDGGFDRFNTDLRVTYTIGGTDCSPPMTGTLSSTTNGDLVPVLDIGNTNVIGYYWSTTADITAQAEKYTLHIHCDGTQHVHGCDVARPVTVTVQAFDRNGDALTYLDDSGQTQFVMVTLDAGSITPVLDATITETNCGNSCGIGQCVSACEHACPNGPLSRSCRDGCQCVCKIQKHNEDPNCHKNAPLVCTQ